MKRPVLKDICWGNWLFFIIVTFLFIVSLLSACGTKGALVLPDDESKPKISQQIINLKNTYT
jgi:predicted small lipoprotein YifL